MNDIRNLVEIKKFVKPDIKVMEKRRTYTGEEYFKMSFVFKENIVVEQQCREDGSLIPYRENVYYGTRVEKDLVTYSHPKFGWVIHEEATEQYRNHIAEQELLG